jgi:hypothetical protein
MIQIANYSITYRELFNVSPEYNYLKAVQFSTLPLDETGEGQSSPKLPLIATSTPNPRYMQALRIILFTGPDGC